ncbi:class I SAM-dependent methyltransferase [Actinoplanes regularis]|uniref:Methyltransferase domain-containing protein n=1 Tax=Actinoplanes regularis TaxID=52697 RepID=A0A238W2U6_9ACTN|nr:class I SAM-dependent methyltransferase [Actinoplanes regularis]GIE85342.1 methyltransferase [Actinoplanes regularis]SNR40463.1 Methyltransferase domain-containing protein [Actinoplanes regularis]
MTPATYSFDNDDPVAAGRHRLLAEVLDPFTVERLAGLGDLTGRRCLEAGAGGGSVATWLAERAGPGGSVLATDLNPRHLRTDLGYAVLRHDLSAEPVPDPPWDLIHARLVLSHLPARAEILDRLAAALAPGGTLVIEEWASAYRGLVLAAPDATAAALVERYHDILVGRLLPGNGGDPAWGGSVHGAMLAAGLCGVGTEIRASSWAGGTAGARLIAVNIEQLRPGFLAAGLTERDLGELCRLSEDPRLVIRGHFTYSTVGRRR